MIGLKRRKAPKMGVREPERIDCPGHLKFVRGFECAIAGRAGHVCGGKIEAAHVRTGTDGGTSYKPSDCWAIPLCSEGHREQHQIGEHRFEKKYGVDMKKQARAIWQRSAHRRKYEQ